MKLLRRQYANSTTTNATGGQLGAAATPAAHTATAPTYDNPARDELAPDERTDGIISAEHRRWRSPATVGTLNAPLSGSESTDMGAVPAAHMGVGHPNPRQVWDSGPIGAAGYPLPKNEALYPSPELLVNSRDDVVITANAAPERVRGGSTGADATRVAEMPRWMFFRPFDQWAAWPFGSTGVTKIEEGSPLASTPISDSADAHLAVPSSSGRWGARGMTPAGVSPNTVRLAPKAWDELAVLTAQSATPEAARRANGWRAR